MLLGRSLTAAQPAAAASMTTASISPVSSVVFVAVEYKNTSGSVPDVSTITGLGGTWQQCGAGINSANGNNKSCLWYGYNCSGSGTLVITATTTPTSANAYAVFEFSGILAGVGAVVTGNFKSVAGTATANNVTVTPNALANRNNAFVVAVQHQTAEDVTPSQGIEIVDNNAANANGLEVNYLIGWTSGGEGGTWSTTTGSQGRVIGIEVVAGDGPRKPASEPLPLIPRGRSM